VKASDIGKINCGVAQTLAVIGDRWTMMILRNAFYGMKSFEAFQDHLDISTSVLSDRLNRLIENGVLVKVPSAKDGRASLYRLTEKGLDLYPVMVALKSWGETHHPNPKGKRLILQERGTKIPIDGVAVLTEDGRKVTARDVTPLPGPAIDPHLKPLVEHRAGINQDKTEDAS
jgi:DNA-binding HxlR family transcriptional regulator